MNKKALAILLALLTLFLVSCGSALTEEKKNTEPSDSTAISEAPTERETETQSETVPEIPTETETAVKTETKSETEAQSETETPALTETETETETAEPEKADPAVILKDTKMVFFGDSIVHASTHDTDYYARYGWPGRIGTDYGAKRWLNAGQDGASVSNIRGTNTVYAQVKNNRNHSYDFVVLEGGVNDAWDNAKVGTLSEMPVNETDLTKLDLSTLAGGLEHLFHYVKEYFPDATVLYVLNFKMGSNQGSLMNMRKYIDVTIAACEKYGISYLNLYDDKEFNADFAITTKVNAVDGIHPNSSGYDLLAPVIAQAMADAYIEQHS